ncbi:MAG: zinc-dependent peptidase [Planctomycetes bacterium]|nr:zinc-dependent peptidase [Planctomycetota bacterium]
MQGAARDPLVDWRPLAQSQRMSWWKPWTWWRRADAARSVPFARWEAVCRRAPWWRELSSAERARLVAYATELRAAWTFTGCGGLALDEANELAIAAQAALLVLGLGPRALLHVSEVLVYPSAVVNPLPRATGGGVISEGLAVLGEAWHRGPVVLAWDAVALALDASEDRHNLVWHEFAHQLDLRDGAADGRPPLEQRVSQQRWYEVLKAAYDALVAADARGRVTVLDGYGATNPAEFFAVATEAFFGRPLELERTRPELYRTLADYYLQDPAARERARETAMRL